MLDNGSSIEERNNIEDTGLLLAVKNNEGVNCLIAASLKGHYHIVKYLVNSFK